MTSAELKTQIDSEVTNKAATNSVSPTNVGDNLKDVVDYVVQEINALPLVTNTSGATTLSATQQVVPRFMNFFSFTGGKAFLPATTTIGRQFLVIAVANNIEVFANEANTNFMFLTYNTFINKVTLATNEMYRFTYIGFNYWKAELL